MLIRPASASERLAVAEIHRSSASAAYAGIFSTSAPFPWSETVRRWRDFQGELLVAELAGALVGFVAFDATELHALYVLPAHWGSGVGRQLLNRAPGVTALWVLEDNVRARRFYEQHGWYSDGTKRQAYGVTELRYRR